MDLATFLQQCFNGLSVASIYMLVAVGVTLVFGVTGLVNFAHGELMMVGAYVAFFVAPAGGASSLGGIAAGMLAVGVLAWALERGIFRHTFSRPVNGFLVSLGLILVLQNALIEIWSINPQQMQGTFDGIFRLGGVRISAQRLFVILVTVALFVALYLLMTRTRWGLAMRAAAVDPEVTASMGIPVPRVVTAVFVLGGLLAGVAGTLLATMSPITPLLGSQVVVKGFAIALVGGLGNAAGAMVAAVILGLAEAMVAGAGFAELKDLVSFALMILIVVVRPQGIFRGTEAKI